MKIRDLISLLVLPFLFACGGGSPAVGTWKLESDATLDANEDQMANQPAAAREMMEGMFDEMSVTVTLESGGTMSGDMRMRDPMSGEAQESSMEGTWELDGDELTLTTTERDGEEVEEEGTATLDGDTLTMTTGQFSVVLVR